MEALNSLPGVHLSGENHASLEAAEELFRRGRSPEPLAPCPCISLSKTLPSALASPPPMCSSLLRNLKRLLLLRRAERISRMPSGAAAFEHAELDTGRMLCLLQAHAAPPLPLTTSSTSPVVFRIGAKQLSHLPTISTCSTDSTVACTLRSGSVSCEERLQQS